MTSPGKPRAGEGTPAQRSHHQKAAQRDDATVPVGTDSSLPRAEAISGHRVRVPVPLLISRRHSPLAVATYALVDMLTPRRVGARPLAWSREQIADRLGVPVRTLADALRALSAAHDGAGLGEVHPAYLATRRRGYNLTADRAVAPVVPFVEVPAWTLGDVGGPLVSHRAWRLYAATVLKRLKDGTCRLPAGELAGLIGVRRQSVPAILAELEAAGLVVTAPAPGRATVVLPVMAKVSDEERAELAERLAVACGYAPDTWSPDRLSPGPLTTRRGGPQTTRLSKETQLPETHRDDTGGAPPRALAPPGLTAAPLADAGSVVEILRSAPGGPDAGRATPVPPTAAWNAARAALAERNAARRVAERAAAAEREQRLSALVAAGEAGVAA